MGIRKNVLCFQGGALVRLDLDEKGRAVGKEVKEPAKAKDPVKEPTRGELRDALRKQLKEAGVSFPATAGVDALKAILDKHEKEKAPPEKTEGGTGNQDVI